MSTLPDRSRKFELHRPRRGTPKGIDLDHAGLAGVLGFKFGDPSRHDLRRDPLRLHRVFWIPATVGPPDIGHDLVAAYFTGLANSSIVVARLDQRERRHQPWSLDPSDDRGGCCFPGTDLSRCLLARRRSRRHPTATRYQQNYIQGEVLHKLIRCLNAGHITQQLLSALRTPSSKPTEATAAGGHPTMPCGPQSNRGATARAV
jgi:hypothetical protein